MDGDDRGAQQRDGYVNRLLEADLTKAEQVIGLLWLNARGRSDSESSIDDLLDVLESRGMAQQNRSRIKATLAASKAVVRGTKRDSLRLAVRSLQSLRDKYSPLLERRDPPEISDEYLPKSIFPGSRKYLTVLSDQINGCYECGYYDAAAVLLRRIVESLIIEIYVVAKRSEEIKTGDSFHMLDRLITHFNSDHGFVKSKELVKALTRIKSVGDNAAHSRTYITHRQDVDDLKFESRRAISELLTISHL